MWLIHWLREKLKEAKLEFSDKLYIERFDYSIRISLAVIHKSGTLPVHNAIGYLTIKTEGVSLRDLAVNKACGLCELLKCNRCGGKYYLASVLEEDNGIVSEPLPWAIPIDCGSGLDNLKYKHVTHIPVKGRVYLRLFDIYKVLVEKWGEEREEFYLIKVHSEYGTEYYPRICLRLPSNGVKGKFTIKFEVAIAGEDLRSSPRTEIKIELDNKDYILYHREKPVGKFSELLAKYKYLKIPYTKVVCEDTIIKIVEQESARVAEILIDRTSGKIICMHERVWSKTISSREEVQGWKFS